MARWRRELWHLRHGGVRAWRRARARRGVPGAGAGGVGRAGAAGVPRPPESVLDLPAWPVPDAPPRRRGLQVAVVLDEFSARALAPEWQQVPVTPRDWRERLTREPVDLLLVESAWHGTGGAWSSHLVGPSAPRPALRELVAWCRARGVPTVFWNKEDPAHYADFLGAARLFDHVFTTDGDRLADYRRDLGHDRVGVLPFAAQPALHSPVRRLPVHQERDVAFAGMWFAHRHPERRAQLAVLLAAADRAGTRMATGLEILSRQHGGDERYQFPAPWDRRVVGALPYPRMLTAYRAYKVFLNANTVVGSPTMCARRVFEISASGTPVVSTPSAALAATFPPDEVARVADEDEAEQVLRALVRSPALRDRMVHRAQRRIWAGHTYAHRVDDVLRAAGLEQHVRTGGAPPRVSTLVCTRRPEQLGAVLRTLAAQARVDVQLVLLAHGGGAPAAEVRARAADAGLADAVVLAAGAEVPLGACLNRLVDAADGDVVAKIDDDDGYGPHYLADQVAALGYSGADVVGKQAHYLYLAGADVMLLRSPEREHRFTDRVSGPTLVTTRDLARAVPFPALPRGEDTGFLAAAVAAGARVYSADRFNFLQMRGADPAAHTWTATDAELLAGGDVEVAGLHPAHVLV